MRAAMDSTSASSKWSQFLRGVDARRLEHVEGDLEIGSAGERHHLARWPTGHALEGLEERVTAELRGVDQCAVYVPQDEARPGRSCHAAPGPGVMNAIGTPTPA